MKLSIINIVIATVILASPALAEPVQVKLTAGQAWDIYKALNSLDGHQEVLHDGDRTMLSPLMPYKFGEGFVWQLAVDITAIEPVAKAYQKAAQSVAFSIGHGSPIMANSLQAEEFTKADDELRSKPVVVMMERLKLKDFALDKTAIPPSTLSILSPIIDP